MKGGTQWSNLSPSLLVGISIVLALAIFIFDLSMPLGVAAGAPYIALVLIGYFAPWWFYIYLMAVLATCLVIIGYFASPDGGIPWVVLTNRGLTLFAIWITAVIGAYIQRKESRFNLAINSASDGIISINSQGIIESFNMGAERIFGYPATEIIGKHFSMLLSSPHRDIHNENILRYLEASDTGPDGTKTGLKAQHRDGTIIPVELDVSKSDYAGKLTYIVIIRDISERVRTADQLNKLSRAVSQSPVSVIITDAHGKIEYVNPKFTQISGYGYDEVIGKNPRILKSGDTPPEEYKKLWDTISSGGQWRGLLHNVKKNGDLYWESATISPIRNTEGTITHFLAVKEDITDRLETENQLAHALKLEATEHLTSGIAHDFNNLLTIITGNLQLLMAGLGRRGNKEIREIIADAISASLDSSELIHRLLRLSRKEKLQAQGIDVNTIIRHIVRFLDRMLGETIAIKIDLQSDIQAIIADQNQLESALLNLAVNARDAMPDGGTLSVKTSRIVIEPDPGAGTKELEPGNYVAITVSDTGIGMDHDLINHACEPFFTTKETGKGSGLGLSMVYTFAKQSRGQLHITSAPGTGTTITLFLPESDYEISDQTAEKITAHIPGGRETILVVEDNNNVRRFAVRSLGNLGYQIIETDNSDTAIEIISGNEQTIDLLFSDILIPGNKNGHELALWAIKQNPSMKVLLTTGTRTDMFDEKSILAAHIPLLKKPYSLEVLAQHIRELLGVNNIEN